MTESVRADQDRQRVRPCRAGASGNAGYNLSLLLPSIVGASCSLCVVAQRIIRPDWPCQDERGVSRVKKVPLFQTSATARFRMGEKRGGQKAASIFLPLASHLGQLAGVLTLKP